MNTLQTGQGGDTAVAVVILRRKRENEAVVVQAQISDAVLRDPTLFSLPITPTAHVPLWKGSPITVEVAGQVPSDDLREAALRVVEREASHLRRADRVADRCGAGHGSAIRLEPLRLRVDDAPRHDGPPDGRSVRGGATT